MKQDANAITFRLYLNIEDIEETVYISDDKYKNLPLTSDLRMPDTESIISEYFTKEKIDEYKRKICEEIMSSENPFDIQEVDSDYYPIEKDKIWK